MREPQMLQTKQPQPHKKDNFHKKQSCHQKSASEGDVEVLSDSSYDTDLAASSDTNDAWVDSDTEFDPDDEIVHEEDEGSSLVLLN